MRLAELEKQLDATFNIDAFPADMPFSTALPAIYSANNIDYKRYLCEKFTRNFHGLMVSNSEDVEKIYGTVFLDRAVLQTIFTKNEKNILIFSHHPMEDQTSGAGFTPLDPQHFSIMKSRGISIYVLHTPLDSHEEISTTRSMVRHMGLERLQQIAVDKTMYITIGELPVPMPFEEFILQIQRVFQNQFIHYTKNQRIVKKIGVIPGGGTDITLIKAAIHHGCDTYVTGDYYNKLTIPWGDEERKVFESERERININLIEASHYSTERLVFIDSLDRLFRKMDIPYEFVEQKNPWY